jgi:hypothetical protein
VDGRICHEDQAKWSGTLGRYKGGSLFADFRYGNFAAAAAATDRANAHARYSRVAVNRYCCASAACRGSPRFKAYDRHRTGAAERFSKGCDR